MAPSGYSTIAAHASSSNPSLWLYSVFGGIFMCKIVYELTGISSPLIFQGFIKLENAKKLEWKNRGFSTIHAIFVAIGAAYLLVISDLFDEHVREEWIINRTSALSDAILGISVGYFLTDLVMIIWTYPTLGGSEYFLHHGLSLLAIGQSLLSGLVQFYILFVLFTEITTPLVNLRWYLDVAGKKNSTLYMLNGVALFVGWLVARVLLFIFFFSHMYAHMYQIKHIYPMGFYSTVMIPSALALMNLFWFWKIAKGMVKTLTNMKEHNHSS
ncbi:uncharacterized protein LOC143631794 [Bidens hawaiensis]|uniref:uncharacterized protein LOC143631794 n=1 Tax=Bidens hawaiensis TaxID=980011 RepID=UPI00404A02DB